MRRYRRQRMAVISDKHSGHKFGLTPPDWWERDDAEYQRISKAGIFQRQLYRFFTKALDSIKPIDILAVNADCIDGKGDRSGGVELITTDRLEQIRMAAEAINYAEAPVVRLTYGTRYHSGQIEDYESLLAIGTKDREPLVKGNVSIHGHDFFTVNGVNIDMKHKVGGSTIPHGRMTAMARARLWNTQWFTDGERQPKADIIIRSHVHYHTFCGTASWLGVTTPALTYNSAFGIRECEGVVDVGIMVFDFDEKGGYTWRVIMADFDRLKVQSESV
jgi:hypothetical protein